MIDYTKIRQYVFEKLVNEYENRKFPVHTSPRIIGDAMQEWISDILEEYYNDPAVFKHSRNFSRKALEDCAVYLDGEYHAIDIKTHCKSASHSSPNLVSIKRLYKFFRNHPTRYFDIMMIDYTLAGDHIQVDNVRFAPIQHIRWDCLNIVNIGAGQLQLKDAECIILEEDPHWYTTFMERVKLFYTKQYQAISKNIAYFGL